MQLPQQLACCTSQQCNLKHMKAAAAAAGLHSTQLASDNGQLLW
jgi:hypothetical protein